MKDFDLDFFLTILYEVPLGEFDASLDAIFNIFMVKILRIRVGIYS